MMRDSSWIERGRWFHATIVWLAQGGANTVEVFWHGRFGHRYLGIHSLLAFPILLVYGEYWSSHGYDTQPLAHFVLLYLILLVAARLGCGWRRWRGDIEHSRYSGRPRFFKPKTFDQERRIKEFAEPLLTIALGLAIAEYSSPPLGMWLVIAGLCLAGVNSLSRQYQRLQETEMQDALIEQRMRGQQARQLERRLGL